MTQPSDINYFLFVDGDKVPLTGPITVGRHLDNDLLLAGEDVLDYHLRLELTDRGPWVIPLGEAALRVNGSDRAEPLGVMPGDVLSVGQSELTVQAETAHPAEADEWRLHGTGDAQGRVIAGPFRVGRGEDSDLTLPDDHISRRHAQFDCLLGAVWLRDLGSANGTYVNGERVAGACRLFHGDDVRFDALAFQLIGRGADLTPVRLDDADDGEAAAPARLSVAAERGSDTTELAAVELHPAVMPRTLPDNETGAFLLGISEPVASLTFRTPMGRTLIGRHEDCDLVIRDRTVSGQHAELMVRAEGVTITNLMATNGIRVNGDEVQTARLYDGDVLRFGRVSLMFKDVPAAESARPWLRRVQLALLVASLLLAAGLILFLV